LSPVDAFTYPREYPRNFEKIDMTLGNRHFYKDQGKLFDEKTEVESLVRLSLQVKFFHHKQYKNSKAYDSEEMWIDNKRLNKSKDTNYPFQK